MWGLSESSKCKHLGKALRRSQIDTSVRLGRRAVSSPSPSCAVWREFAFPQPATFSPDPLDHRAGVLIWQG